MPMYGNMNYGSQRDDIADSLMNQKMSTFDYGLAGLPQQAMSPMTGPTLAGFAADAGRRRAGCRIAANWSSHCAATTAATGRHARRDADDGRTGHGTGACNGTGIGYGTGLGRHAAAGAAAQTSG